MRKEIELWWEQAKRDLVSAKNSFDAKDYYASCFWCHQAVEKSLKTLIMKKQKKQAVVSHSLIFLGKEAGVPGKFHDFLRELTPQYTISRYPSAGEEAPFELFSEKKSREFLDKSREVVEWIKKQL
ncbi:MAG: HEPN domain-containing protein [Candidatus Diapherotrites archaeon]|nr:HEPN domain-containing protein [Candidatus Diapherotrites archaeon]